MNKFGIASLSCLGTLAVIAGGTAVGLNIPTIKDKVAVYFNDNNVSESAGNVDNNEDNSKIDVIKLTNLPEELLGKDIDAEKMNENLYLITASSSADVDGFYVYDTNKHQCVEHNSGDSKYSSYKLANGNFFIYSKNQNARGFYYYNIETNESTYINEGFYLCTFYKLTDNLYAGISFGQSDFFIVNIDNFEVMSGPENSDYLQGFIKMEEGKYLVFSSLSDEKFVKIYDLSTNSFTELEFPYDASLFSKYQALGDNKYFLSFSLGKNSKLIFDYNSLTFQVVDTGFTSSVLYILSLKNDLYLLSSFSAFSVYDASTNEVIYTSSDFGRFDTVIENEDGTYTFCNSSPNTSLSVEIIFDIENREVVSYNYVYHLS